MFRPEGNKGYEFVAAGNLLLIRRMMLLLVASSRGCRFLLEQPAQSCLSLHPRWDWFVDRVCVALSGDQKFRFSVVRILHVRTRTISKYVIRTATRKGMFACKATSESCLRFSEAAGIWANSGAPRRSAIWAGATMNSLCKILWLGEVT